MQTHFFHVLRLGELVFGLILLINSNHNPLPGIFIPKSLENLGKTYHIRKKNRFCRYNSSMFPILKKISRHSTHYALRFPLYNFDSSVKIRKMYIVPFFISRAKMQCTFKSCTSYSWNISCST